MTCVDKVARVQRKFIRYALRSLVLRLDMLVKRCSIA
jgi:hypothetical protein